MSVLAVIAVALHAVKASDTALPSQYSVRTYPAMANRVLIRNTRSRVWQCQLAS